MVVAFSAYIWLIYGGVRDLHQSEIAPFLLIPHKITTRKLSIFVTIDLDPHSINSTLSYHSFIFYSLSYAFRAHSIDSNSIFILIIDSYMYKLIHHDFAY